MNHAAMRRAPASGFAIIEVLVTLLVLLVGLLGLAGLLVQSQRYEIETYQRAQALIVMQDMVERIKANRQVAPCYVVTTDTSTGAPYLGTGASDPSACAATVTGATETKERALQDMEEWHDLLLGSNEQIGTARKVGGLINARGCVSFDATSSLYTVTVAWQGLGASATPGSGTNCGKALYGSEADALRRVVTMTLRIGDLNA